MKTIIKLSIIILCLASGQVQAQQTLSSLKAILVVGHQEDGTQEAIKKMDQLAKLFKKQGIKVATFYDQKADWTAIKKASKGASFFVYAGHGSTLGKNGTSGGLCITSRISSQTLVEELKLKKNALVIFKSVCRGAGSSAGDNKDIGIKEATKRVSNYSQPFFQLGGGCYYANNLGSGCYQFLQDFFTGKTVQECFYNSATTWCKIELKKKSYKYDSNKKVSIATTDWGGMATQTTYINGKKIVTQVPVYKSYDIALVANPAFSLKNVLQ